MRAAFSLLLALLLLLEAAGVARAVGVGSMVHCCCGPHSVARTCACLRCPVKLRRAQASDHDHHEASLAPPGSCVPTVEADVLVVLATVPVPPSLADRTPAVMDDFIAIPPLAGLAADPSRPPP